MRPSVQPAIDVFSNVDPALKYLGRTDAALNNAIRTIKTPHIRRRSGGFAGLFRIIVEQQVSVPSAQAILKRCENACDISPKSALSLGHDGLKACGLSTPKARYILELARTVESGALDFDALTQLPNGDAITELTRHKGIGPWTAAIYLLFCEGRIDIWPVNDVALQSAYGAAAGRIGKAAGKELDLLAEGWRPYRGVAAHILWTYYAHIKGRAPI